MEHGRPLLRRVNGAAGERGSPINARRCVLFPIDLYIPLYTSGAPTTTFKAIVFATRSAIRYGGVEAAEFGTLAV